MSQNDLPLDSLTALSPLDGRYRDTATPLAELMSEYGLIRNRVRVEVEWFIHLAEQEDISALPAPGEATKQTLRGIWENFTVADAAEVRKIERTTNHDVKAVEYFVKGRLVQVAPDLTKHKEFVHFACTSEDINNLAYALMLKQAIHGILLPIIDDFITYLGVRAQSFADIPMLARTHGQPASPTTVGKELFNFVMRLERQRNQIAEVEYLGKMNGAVGNYNAHVIALPDVDWPQTTRTFVEGKLGLTFNPYTTQIEPHDSIAELCHALKRCNQVLLDFDRDIWAYISIGYFRKQVVDSETGSSTMPHKVNPIDFENSEGNIGLANALLDHFAEKLTVSRWQRDLSDSTALRSLGSALGYSLMAYTRASQGLSKLEISHERIERDLNDAWEVLAEAVQMVMRVTGAEEPYEALKAATRGKHIDQTVYKELLANLDLSDEDRIRLLELSPSGYIGLASELVEQELEYLRHIEQISNTIVDEELEKWFDTTFTLLNDSISTLFNSIIEDGERLLAPSQDSFSRPSKSIKNVSKDAHFANQIVQTKPATSILLIISSFLFNEDRRRSPEPSQSDYAKFLKLVSKFSRTSDLLQPRKLAAGQYKPRVE